MYKVKLLRRAMIFFAVFCSPLLSAESLRDPTHPLVNANAGSAASEPTITLNSILIGKTRKLVVINGVALHEGDSVPGHRKTRVKKIYRTSVVLDENGKTQRIPLAKNYITPLHH